MFATLMPFYYVAPLGLRRVWNCMQGAIDPRVRSLSTRVLRYGPLPLWMHRSGMQHQLIWCASIAAKAILTTAG
jgi:hypothetical protein